MPERRNKDKGLNKTEFAGNVLSGVGNTLALGLSRRSQAPNNKFLCELSPGFEWNDLTQECEAVPSSGRMGEGTMTIPPITSTPGGGIQGGIEGAQPSPFEPFPAGQALLRILQKNNIFGLK